MNTSGIVTIPHSPNGYGQANPLWGSYTWEILPLFTQGYIAEAFEHIEWPDPNEGYGPSSEPRFDWLAPEALEQIIRDCTKWNREWTTCGHFYDEREQGAYLWRLRQADKGAREHGFPPLTLYLSPDGLLHLRERGR